MIKITFILSFLLAGIASFAGQSVQQSTQTNQKSHDPQSPVICTVTAWVGNVRIQATAADCATAWKKIYSQQIDVTNWSNPSTSPVFGNNGSFSGNNTTLP